MVSSYSFDLPPELIAQTPPTRRGDSRLLRVTRGRGVAGEAVFRELPSLLRAGDRLVLNDSRVRPARLLTRRLDTGGRVEILLTSPAADPRWPGGWFCLARPARRLRSGVQLVPELPAGAESQPAPIITVLDRADSGDGGQVVVAAERDLGEVAETWGVMPLPPYIKRPTSDVAASQQDRRRYQTVYARGEVSGGGSVAAPTAGLHFSHDTLAHLRAAGIGISRVSLHVGPGTFQPPSPDQIDRRRLHRESFHLPAAVSREIAATRAAGGRVIAVGTTSLRVLETVQRLDLAAAGEDECIFGATAADPDPVFAGSARRLAGQWEVAGATRLFISPPDRVTAVDGLLTNFHLPDSSLLMLVAALLGPSTWRPVYEHAVAEAFRFYSYGDCMLILPDVDPDSLLPRRGA